MLFILNVQHHRIFEGFVLNIDYCYLDVVTSENFLRNWIRWNIFI